VCPGHSLTQRTQKAKLRVRVFCHGPKGVEKLSCAKTIRLRAGPQVPTESSRGLLEVQSSCSRDDAGLPCSLNQGRLSLQGYVGNTGCVPMQRRFQCAVDACTMIRSRTGRDKRYMYEGRKACPIVIASCHAPLVCTNETSTRSGKRHACRRLIDSYQAAQPR
jgi:hypothetical protein